MKNDVRKVLVLAAMMLACGWCNRVVGAEDKVDTGTGPERTAAAEKVLDAAYTPTALRESFSKFLNPALDAMKAQGMPDAARAEMRRAFTEWFDENVKWEEMRPRLVQLYAKDFTLDELRGLLALYQQPVGQRILAKLPVVMQDGAVLGQQYFMSKQESLAAKINPIVEKYKKRGQ